MSSKDEPPLPIKPAAEAHNLAHDEARAAPKLAFTRDISVSLVAEFRRLAILNGWGKKTKDYKAEKRKRFHEWAVEDFDREFGSTANSLSAWQKLCRRLGVGEGLVFGSIPECTGALHGIYVNIVDLVDACKTPDAKPRIFSSEQDLAKYIQRTGKVFPLSKARDNPLLSTFLIHVNANGRGGGGRGSAGRRRRRKAKAKAKADAEAKVAEEAKEKGTVEAKASATKADGKDK